MLKRYLILLFLAYGATCKADTAVPYHDHHIHYMGRVSLTSDAARLTWTASSVVINFDGTGAKATLSDDTGFDLVTVVVDDKVVNTIQPKNYKKEYQLISGLPSGKHKLELFKRTEYDMGTLSFYKFTLEGEGKLLAAPQYKHRIEFYGNSITCGYAIEDKEGKDRGTYEFENGYKSYANITARRFDADLYCISKSGIGVVISWFDYVMNDIYDRVAAHDSIAKWDFKRYTPEVVVVNLFQNDSWLVLKPEHEQFKKLFGETPPSADFIIAHYRDLISKIRSKYPNAKIICALGSMDATKKGSPWPGYIEKAVSQMNDKNVYTHFFPYKNTPGHPSEKEQQDMANSLIGFIQKKFRW